MPNIFTLYSGVMISGIVLFLKLMTLSKKWGISPVVTVAIVMDYIIVILTSHIGIDMPKSVFLGLLVTVWYILNEILSIIENAGRMDVPVPEWLMRYIAVLKKKIDDKGEGVE